MIRKIPGFTLVELMVSIAVLGLLLCFGMPLYHQHSSMTQAKFFEKELAACLTTARLQAFLLGESLRLEPIRLGDAGTWHDGVRLRREGGEILHQWLWSDIPEPLLWFGFHAKHFIRIEAHPEKLAMNGYFQVGEHQLVVNRFGRIR